MLISWLAIIQVSSRRVAISGANLRRSTTTEERPFSAKVSGRRVIHLLVMHGQHGLCGFLWDVSRGKGEKGKGNGKGRNGKVTNPLLMKLGPGLDLPNVDVHWRRFSSSSFDWEGADGIRDISHVLTSHSPH